MNWRCGSTHSTSTSRPRRARAGRSSASPYSTATRIWGGTSSVSIILYLLDGSSWLHGRLTHVVECHRLKTLANNQTRSWIMGFDSLKTRPPRVELRIHIDSDISTALVLCILFVFLFIYSNASCEPSKTCFFRGVSATFPDESRLPIQIRRATGIKLKTRIEPDQGPKRS